MGIYQFSEAEREHLEQLPTSLAVYQYADGKVYPLVLSDGYRAMFRLPDREKTYRLLSEDVLYNTHPDDALSVRTKFELKMLRDVVTEELMRVQESILSKAFQDVLDGKLEEENFPLRRITTPNGNETITNVPVEFMTIASFMAWLNDKTEE